MLELLGHKSVMITGERRIGKTSLLHHLKKALAAEEVGDHRFFPVFVDLEGVPEPEIFRTFMAEMVESLGLSPTLVSLASPPGRRATTSGISAMTSSVSSRTCRTARKGRSSSLS